MKSQPLFRVSVQVRPEAEEAVVELLFRILGQPAAVYTNEETHVTVVSVYLPKRIEWNSKRKALLAAGLADLRTIGLDMGPCTVETGSVRRQDWAESWKKHFKPISISKRLLIKPSWIKRRRLKNQSVVILDPGLSFGTGNHPTTSFCLHEVVKCLNPGPAQSMWDVGTGSGILAIAAAKLGFAPIHAIDFDPESVRVAKENAISNRVMEKIRLSRRDLTKIPPLGRPQYHLICANLISTLLLSQRDKLVCRLRPGGTLVLAGILKEEFAQVRDFYCQAGLRFVHDQVDGEWCSGAFTRADAAS